MFKRNEGILDRTVRVVLALVLLPACLVWFLALQGGVFALVVAGFGVLLLITGLTGVCPLYIPFGINTLEKEKELIARCASMMAGFRQSPAGSGHPGLEHMCGPCLPSSEKTHNQHG